MVNLCLTCQKLMVFLFSHNLKGCSQFGLCYFVPSTNVWCHLWVEAFHFSSCPILGCLEQYNHIWPRQIVSHHWHLWSPFWMPISGQIANWSVNFYIGFYYGRGFSTTTATLMASWLSKRKPETQITAAKRATHYIIHKEQESWLINFTAWQSYQMRIAANL